MVKVNPHKLPPLPSGGEPGPDWRQVDWDAHERATTLEDGTEVSYVDYGSGPGPVVLLVHGLGGSWRVWLANLAHLGQTHRVVAVDLPGFGASPPDGSPGRYDTYAATLDRLCADLGISRVVAVGNSFGGWISAELARRNPALVAGLVLVDAAGIPCTPAERRKVVGMLRMADRLAPASSRNRDLLGRRPQLRRRALAFVVSRADRIPDDLAVVIIPQTPSPVFRTVLEAAVLSWSADWCASLGALDVPALVVWGERDRQLPMRHAEEWVRHLARAELVVIAGAGHMPMLEEPGTVNAHLRQFLDRAGKEAVSAG
ncbi:MAG: alpha/beta fold hydrolase [Nocardioides sp.]